MRRNELYFNLVEKIFENGQKTEFHEIAEEAITQLGEENYDEKKLRNLIYRMKNKGELLRTKDGKYYKPEGSKETNEETKESKYDFTNFVQIKASSRKEPEEMLSVWTNGEFAVNSKLLKHFPEYKMSILISEDCSEIVLFLEGKEMINVGKNGRTKNYDLQKRIKTQKKNLPAHYIGKWDEEEKLWYGKYSPYNPNKGEKHLKK